MTNCHVIIYMITSNMVCWQENIANSETATHWLVSKAVSLYFSVISISWHSSETDPWLWLSLQFPDWYVSCQTKHFPDWALSRKIWYRSSIWSQWFDSFEKILKRRLIETWNIIINKWLMNQERKIYSNVFVVP